MLFSSHAFLFIFLPLVLLSFHLARSFISGKAALLVVITASLFFYGYWNPPFLFLLVGSMLVNFGFV
ncbi:MBOAT family protein, partial [bacterium]|nr:MBOAT family protein [bacterium]